MPKPKGKGKGKFKKKGKGMNRSLTMCSSVMNLSGSRFTGFIFPPRLRANFRVAFNNIFTFTSVANNYLVISLSNGINVVSSQTISGLYWLLSGQQNNGTSYAPYSLAVIRRVKMEIYAKTVANPTGNTGTLLCLYPLAYGNSSTGLSLTNAEEQFGRSNIIELPITFDSVPHRRPMITKYYNVWDLIGITEETYMNSLDEHSFTYSGMLSTATSQYVALQCGTESGNTDSNLAVRYNVIMELEIEFYGRNGAVVTAPHS